MSPSAILAAFVVLVLVDLSWSLFLTGLNFRRAAESRPVDPRLGLDAEALAKARAYARARMVLGSLEGVVTTAAMLLVAVSGLFGALDRIVGAALASPYWRAAAFLGILALASGLLGAPFSLYADFRLERRFGFGTTRPATWCLDRLKGLALGAALGLPLLALVDLLLRRTGGLWWLWVASALALVNLGLSLIHPLLIAPLFNRFTPLPEGSLKDAIGDLTQRLGFRNQGVFVMDGSTRSRHSNAYFTGLGAGRRIVLYDTLVAAHPEAEVLAVLAHEIGHERHHHVRTGTVVSVAATFLGLWVLSLLAAWPSLFVAFGFPGTSLEALLLVFSLVSGPATFLLTPLFSWWSRRHEYEADAFAAAALGPGPMAAALVRLDRDNASNPDPHPLYSFWHYSHPAPAERLAALEPAT